MVIGQSNYAGLSRLSNPANDARKMANVLADHGFDLIACDGQASPCLDMTRSGMLRALTALELAADGAELALVFYAGHGMEGEGGNVLAPIDATVDCATQQVARGVLLEQFILASSPARSKVIILDACRDNPLAQICPPATGKEQKALSFKDIKVPDARDFLLLTSTKPGQQAQDGVPGTNSPFAKALFAELEIRPEIYFDQLFNYVARAVVEATRNSSPTQLPEALVRGGAPRDCLRGRTCAADPQSAALAAEVAALRSARAQKDELLGVAAAQQILDRAVAQSSVADQGQVNAIESLLVHGNKFDGKDLAGISLAGAKLSGGSFSEADFKGSDLSSLVARGANLSSVSLSWATLHKADFAGSSFDKSFVGFALAEGSVWKGLLGQQSQWFGSDLRGADFSGADLRLANFQFSDLTGANFRNAKLNGAYFVGSILSGADFTGAEFDVTDLTLATADARQFSAGQLKAACRTRLAGDGQGSGRFQTKLTSYFASSRFASGKEFRDEYLQAYLEIPGTHPGLPICPHRNTIPVHRMPIAFTAGTQDLRGELGMHIQKHILDTSGRRAKFRERAAQHMQLIQARLLGGAFVSAFSEPTPSLPRSSASGGRIAASDFHLSSAKYVLPLLKVRDLPEKRRRGLLDQVSSETIQRDLARWKSLIGNVASKQKFEESHGGRSRHEAIPISWEAASKGNSRTKRAFLELALTNNAPLGDLLPNEDCVSKREHKCHIAAFIFDPRDAQGQEPELVALKKRNVITSLFEAMTAVLPDPLPFDGQLHTRSVNVEQGGFSPQYGSEMLSLSDQRPPGSEGLRIYRTEAFTEFMRHTTQRYASNLGPNIRSRIEFNNASILELLTPLVQARGLSCYEYLGFDRVLSWDRVRIPQGALPTTLAAVRKKSDGLSYSLNLRSLKIIFDEQQASGSGGGSCLITGSITSVDYHDSDGKKLFGLPATVFAATK